MSPDRVATYRLQLRPGFGFAEAAAIAPYLARLGVSHVYCSPIWQAAPGSEHGYDVVDPGRINEELGGDEGWRALVDAAAENGLRILLDIVPNHMAIVPENPWWQDVLRHGAMSRFAHFFDVDWDPPNGSYSNQVLLPVLGDHYGRVLEAGEIVLSREGSRFELRYFEHVFPVDPASIDLLLLPAAASCRSDRLAFLAEAFGQLRHHASGQIRLRRVGVLESMLGELLQDNAIGDAMDDQVALLNRDADRLDELVQRQNYRLAFWRMAGQELGYRRFFDIHSLAGMRVEEAGVFDDVHDMTLGLFESDLLDGLRVDHPDGLRDPAGYFRRLREKVPRAWLLAEKILMPGEALPEDWPVDGTTGYEFFNLVTGLFVDPEGIKHIDRFYQEFTGNRKAFEDVVRECKRMIAGQVLGSELNQLVSQLGEICARHRRHRDYSRQDIAAALIEFAAAFPVYRSYVRHSAGEATDTDRHYVDSAMEHAIESRQDLDPLLFHFLRDILLLRVGGEREGRFAMRFQQFTSPLMAKGLEDTALFRFNRLVACNEVGGDPGNYPKAPAEFHHACERTQRLHPQTLLASDTHDTKYSADVHARLAVLSEIPERWTRTVREWSQRFHRHHQNGFPDRNTEYLFYQAVVGAWPIDVERVLAFMQKAAREAKQHTSWLQVDADYEHALRCFVADAFNDPAFIEGVAELVARIDEAARRNSLSLTLLKLTAPGVPDIYQGTELWAHSLVDPDNRRRVDFEQRKNLLAVLEQGDTVAGDDGLEKLSLLRKTLALRAQHVECFGTSSKYEALETLGALGGHVLAYVRGRKVAVVVPRLTQRVSDWGDTSVLLPPGHWRNVLGNESDSVSGGRTKVGELLREFPVALLVEGETG